MLSMESFNVKLYFCHATKHTKCKAKKQKLRVVKHTSFRCIQKCETSSYYIKVRYGSFLSVASDMQYGGNQ